MNKLNQKDHCSSCNPLACDCPTIGESLAELDAAIEEARNGVGVPPWMTQEQAIECAVTQRESFVITHQLQG